ncbi:MAG: hypothetical protein IJA60_07345 [Clostridia bacterium]|nr:hypothetical protein [Clostridia bacterium]MBQ6835691.1 hypothetical protein [Clostridia bacterium]
MDDRNTVIIEGEYMCFSDDMHFDEDEIWVCRDLNGRFRLYAEKEYVRIGDELSKLSDEVRRRMARKIFVSSFLIPLENNRLHMNNRLRDYLTSSKYIAVRKENYLLLEPIEE